MKLETASRKKAKIKLAIQGPSGSGKTMSALQLAYGICNNWASIAVIDTENHSAELYAHLGNYNVVNIGLPYTPEKYCEAIKLCENAGMEVIIIDSISHEWEGSGGILDIHANMVGNSFTNWSKLTPRHNAFIQTILQSPSHIIGTIRSKQDYVLQEKNGKMIPEKVGLKGITRDGMDYEFTIVFDIDIKHNASTSKDRTQLFTGKPEFRISSETGTKILAWCNSGTELSTISSVDYTEQTLETDIKNCISIADLVNLYNLQDKEKQEKYKFNFTNKRNEIVQSNDTNPITHISKTQQNGNTYIKTS